LFQNQDNNYKQLSSMASSVLSVFETYQKARVAFVQSVADLATRAQNIEIMQNAGVMQLLRPLLLDNVPSIQQSSALALGRLANYSDDLAEAVVGNEILPQLVYSLSEQNRFYKKAAAFVLRAVAKHSPELAQAVVDSGALESLVVCLEEFDPSVKEAAAWALGYIAGHTGELAQAVVDAGAVPLLVLCVQEPEISLKRIAASALSDIAKHSPELAQAVVDASAVTYLAALITHPDTKLKRQVCMGLAQVAKHSVDLAEVVVEAEIFPKILNCLKDTDAYVQKNASTCIREVAKHTPELAKLIVNAGGASALVEYISEAKGHSRLPGIMALGFVAAFSETLALAVVVSKGVTPLKDALITEPEDHIKAASAWALGQVGRHSPDHARALAENEVLRVLLANYMHEANSADLRTKSKRALKAILKKCTHLPALEPLLKEAPIEIQKYILEQFAKTLPHDQQARRTFVQSGGLPLVCQLAEDADGKLAEHIKGIQDCYPPEIVEYYSPNYANQLMKKIDEFNPAQ
jgi:3-methyladenine DNA glycosylase AlkD